jgi:hypothetical protein
LSVGCKMDKKNNHGGKRERAGKPALFGVPMKRKNVMLDVATIEKLLKIGNGNLSEGIRKAAEKA